MPIHVRLHTIFHPDLLISCSLRTHRLRLGRKRIKFFINTTNSEPIMAVIVLNNIKNNSQ